MISKNTILMLALSLELCFSIAINLDFILTNWDSFSRAKNLRKLQVLVQLMIIYCIYATTFPVWEFLFNLSDENKQSELIGHLEHGEGLQEIIYREIRNLIIFINEAFVVTSFISTIIGIFRYIQYKFIDTQEKLHQIYMKQIIYSMYMLIFEVPFSIILMF